MGRPLASFEIPAQDQGQLQAWNKRPKMAQALAIRSRIVLLAGEGRNNTEIAANFLLPRLHQTHNKEPKPFIWHKTADQILDSVARFCKRTLETGH